MINSYFKGFLVGLFIIFVGFLIIGGILLSINCYKSDTIMDMPGYCALVL